MVQGMDQLLGLSHTRVIVSTVHQGRASSADGILSYVSVIGDHLSEMCVGALCVCWTSAGALYKSVDTVRYCFF